MSERFDRRRGAPRGKAPIAPVDTGGAMVARQDELEFNEGQRHSTKAQQYDPTSIINQVRQI